MAEKLPRWACDDPALSDALNTLAELLEETRESIPEIVGGLGTRVKSERGRVIIQSSAKQGGGGSEADHPFKVIKTAANKVRIVPGSVNNIPAKVDSEENIPPDWPTLTITGSGFVYVRSEWAGDEPMRLDDAVVMFIETDEMPDDGFSVGRQILAQVGWDAETGSISFILQFITDSLFVERIACGDDAKYFWNT